MNRLTLWFVLTGILLIPQPVSAETVTKTSDVSITFVEPTDAESLTKLVEKRQEVEDNRVHTATYLYVDAPGNFTKTITIQSNNETKKFIIRR